MTTRVRTVPAKTGAARTVAAALPAVAGLAAVAAIARKTARAAS